MTTPASMAAPWSTPTLSPGNFVIDGSRAWMVDFGWSMRGPGWVTAPRIIPHLIDEGWPAADAERLLCAIPAWASAPHGTVTAYAADLAACWEQPIDRTSERHADVGVAVAVW